MANLEDLMKKRIPAFQQENPLLDGYLEASGQHFDGFRKAIDQLKGFRDYNEIPFSLINQIGRELGINFPRNLEESMKRNIIRDVFDIYRRLGTDETVLWLFRVIGWTVSRREAWLLNPENYIAGLKKKMEDNGFEPTIEGSPKPMKDLRFDDLVYGGITDNDGNVLEEPVQDEEDNQGQFEGTFFYGEDYYRQVNYEKIPIIGEQYRGYNALNASKKVMKLPYMVIEISEGDYALDLDEYTGEDGQTTYGYTERERYNTILNLINYMLYSVVRPSHVRIIIILRGFQYDDIIENLSDDISVSVPRNNETSSETQSQHEAYILTDGSTQYEIISRSAYSVSDPNDPRIEGYYHRTGGTVPNNRE